VAKAVADGRRGEEANPGGGQLDGEREPVEPFGDVGDGAEVVVGGRQIGAG
jgi:hypothetical protein